MSMLTGCNVQYWCLNYRLFNLQLDLPLQSNLEWFVRRREVWPSQCSACCPTGHTYVYAWNSSVTKPRVVLSPLSMLRFLQSADTLQKGWLLKNMHTNFTLVSHAASVLQSISDTSKQKMKSHCNPIGWLNNSVCCHITVTSWLGDIYGL
jgi:hypothetical protein